MSLVTTKVMLEDAYKNNYAVGAFAAHNLEVLKAVVAGAESHDAPVIIQTTPGTVRYVGINYMTSLVKTAAQQTKVPVALHLDHGNSFEVVCQCLRAGYTSVMIDGSQFPFEENVHLVKKVVEVAHYAGVPVEAELGRIGGVEDDLSVDDSGAGLTDSDAAEEFVRRTEIDSFAPAFGTAHGLYKKDPDLDFRLLDNISQRTGIPIVMHGASGIPEKDVRKAVTYGVSKVNFSTELKAAFVKELGSYLNSHPQQEDPRKYFVTAREKVQEIVKQKIEMIQPAKKSPI